MMKKYVWCITLILLSSTFGIAQAQCIQTSFNTFNCPVGGGGGSNLGAFMPPMGPGNSQSTSYSPEAYAQKQAAEKAAKEAAIKAKKEWCKANNYPASDSYCVEYGAHVRFCQQQPAKIPIAVNTCITQARDDIYYLMSTKCATSESFSFSFAYKIENINVGYQFNQSGMSPELCTKHLEYKSETLTMKCQTGGMEYEVALKNQCSDVI